MYFITNEHSLFNSIFRSAPCTLPIFSIIIFIYTNNITFLYLFLGQYIVQLLTPFFKNIIAYPIGVYLTNIFKTDDIPIIGRFKRPIGATNTGCYYISKDNLSTTEGMPSGHSMLIAFVCVFLYYYIIDFYNIKKQHKIYILFIFLFITIYMMYTRVLMNAHTIQQTIVGSLIGYVLAYYYYIYIKNKIKIKKNI